MFVETQMKCFYCISLIFILLSSISAMGMHSGPINPPERLNILEKIESSKWLNTTAKWFLRNHSMTLLNKEDVEIMSSLNKNRMLTESEIGTSGVLLFEFATGEGPATRYFDTSHQFTYAFMKSPGMYYVMKQYLSAYSEDTIADFDSSADLLNIRYQFSPIYNPLDLKTWDYSLTQHFATWEGKSFSQIFLGSFNADVQFVSNERIRVHVWNRTSKKSLFAGFGKRWQRPLPLGTTTQHITFELTLDQVNKVFTSLK